jgi:DNA-binding beta-propeller fold protein YncE
LAGGVGTGTEHRVGDLVPEGTILPTGEAVKPVGVTAMLHAAPTDIALLDPERVLVKTSQGVSVVRLQDGAVQATLDLKGGTSLTGVAIQPSRDSDTIDKALRPAACSTAGNEVVLLRAGRDKIEETGRIRLPDAPAGGPPYPCGLAYANGDEIVVALNRSNSIAVLSVSEKAVRQIIPVDPGPYGIAVDPFLNIAYVSCWARKPGKGAPTAPSSGTQVEVDARGIGIGGSICRVDLVTGAVVRARVSGQPTEIAWDSRLEGHARAIFVACANGDEVLELDPNTLARRREFRLEGRAGAAPNSLAIRDQSLYVAYGGLNAVAVFDLASGALQGMVPTAWYPSVVRLDGPKLVIATAKGLGSRGGLGPRRSVYDITGTVSYLAPPYSLVPVKPADTGRPSLPIPARAISHVIYVIKENRTYDQILGDMREGNGDPSLVLYGEKVTPNQHALARQFVLLDNYYCNGIISSDGHAWATEGNATTYYERARGGWTRSYPFGDDPLATSASGYLWDDALAHGQSVWNFGEFDYASPVGNPGAFKLLADFLAGKPQLFKQNIGVRRLAELSQPDYPGWNLAIPDILRADRFIRRLHEDERSGRMANLTILYLPQDHTSGGANGYPSPRAQVADNDLAVGRCIDAITHSRFWPSTAVFVTEDDPQDGFDHVDGHRSTCLVISPYTRRGVTVSVLYNQTSVLRTIELMLGLPPMNRNDASATPMAACFQSIPDFHPYVALPNQIPLDEPTPARLTTSFRLDKPDVNDDDAFNRALRRIAGKPASAYAARLRDQEGG